MVRVNKARLPKEKQEELAQLRSRKLSGDFYKNTISPHPYYFAKSREDEYGSVYAMFVEDDVRERVWNYMNPHGVFFDVGAGVGSWTLPALAFGMRVVAFEPDPRSVKTLCESVDLNEGFKERFTIVQGAVCAGDGMTMEFEELEDVPTISLDSFVQKYQIFPYFMKIDVEGMEEEVIGGADQLLKWRRPGLLVEGHSDGFRDVIKTKLWYYYHEDITPPGFNHVRYHLFK